MCSEGYFALILVLLSGMEALGPVPCRFALKFKHRACRHVNVVEEASSSQAFSLV